MKTHSYKTILTIAALTTILAVPCRSAQLLVNGGFEPGFANWTRVDQTGSDGTFASQLGTASPVNGFTVPAPPGPTHTAMTDSQGPGSHVLYQDFTVPASVTVFALSFDLYLNNHAPSYFAPALTSLDFSTPSLNQQFRVDIIKTTADPFSLLAGDILQNIYKTNPGDPLVSGYNTVTVYVTTLLAANLGQTLRLRVAEVDNVDIFNAGIDRVSIADTPEPSTIIAGVAVLGLGALRRRKGPWRLNRTL